MTLDRELWDILEVVGRAIAPGVTTRAIEQAICARLAAAGMAKGYPETFPASAAISVHEMVCNGLPSDRLIRSGDLVAIDVAARRDGAYATAGWTFLIDRPSDPLLDAGHAALRAALAIIRPGLRTGDLGAAIQAPIEAAGFFVVREFVGHVIVGNRPFQPPQLPNFGEPGHGPRLRRGMRLALHVLATSDGGVLAKADDGWTLTGAPGTRAIQLSATVDVGETVVQVIGCLSGFA